LRYQVVPLRLPARITLIILSLMLARHGSCTLTPGRRKRRSWPSFVYVGRFTGVGGGGVEGAVCDWVPVQQLLLLENNYLAEM